MVVYTFVDKPKFRRGTETRDFARTTAAADACMAIGLRAAFVLTRQDGVTLFLPRKKERKKTTGLCMAWERGK